TSQSNDTAYVPPGNTQYPFGDEKQFNVHALDEDTNQIHCVEQKDIKELEGSCPLKQSTEEIADPYIACPGYDTFPPPQEAIYSSNEKPAPEVLCKKCDLRLTVDNQAVVVECFQCYDIPSSDRQANRTERNILYKVQYVAVANYTSVEVTGWENFFEG
ncbi:hypothetical protein NQ315_006892, partial [Exocentrus adspersus]